MIDMYEEFGYYKDAIQAVTMKGIEGLQKIQEIIQHFVRIRLPSLPDIR